MPLVARNRNTIRIRGGLHIFASRSRRAAPANIEVAPCMLLLRRPRSDLSGSKEVIPLLVLVLLVVLCSLLLRTGSVACSPPRACAGSGGSGLCNVRRPARRRA